MRIGDCSAARLAEMLRREGLVLPVGPFRFLVTSPFRSLAEGVRRLYEHHELLPVPEFCDARIALRLAHGWGRLRRDSAYLMVDGERWHRFPARLATAYLEWGMNWTIFRRAHHLLVLHAANVERGGVGLVLPADPGCGKSTLCAGLAHRGWRILSDELALVRLETAELVPLARPVCLKGESLEVIERFAPQARFGPVLFDPDEGRVVGHVRPTPASVEAIDQPARPRLIVFPRYEAGHPFELTPVTKAAALIRVAQSSFNYSLLGELGFNTLVRMLDGCDCYELVYSDLEDATARITRLADERADAPLRKTPSSRDEFAQERGELVESARTF